MFNNYTFDGNYFDSLVSFQLNVYEGQVVYNGYVLHQTNNCYLNFLNSNNGSSLELNNFDIPNDDGEGNNSYFYRSKEIAVKGMLKANTAEELQEIRDEFKMFLSKQNQILQINFNGQIRKANAFVLGLEGLFEDKHYNINWIPFEIRFQILSGYWEDIRSTSITYESITTNLLEEIVNNGTFKTDPKIILNFSSATVSGVNITVNNSEISITETIKNGDLLIIDSAEKTVTLNGSVIDFDGVFPTLETGANSILVDIDGTFTVDVSILYVKRFI